MIDLEEIKRLRKRYYESDKDRIYKLTPENLGHTLRIRGMAEYVCKFHHGGIVLELGCGPFPTQNIGSRLICLDWLWANRCKFPDTHHVMGLIEIPPIRNMKFDVVVWGEGPEHVRHPELVLKWIQSITDSFVCSCPDGRDGNPFHLSYFTFDSLMDILGNYFTYVMVKKTRSWLIGAASQEKFT